MRPNYIAPTPGITEEKCTRDADDINTRLKHRVTSINLIALLSVWLLDTGDKFR